jgi:hypothetical protein
MKKNIIDESEVFEISDNLSATVFTIGPKKSKVVIVDNFYKNPNMVRELALAIPPTRNSRILGYMPGSRIDAFYNLEHFAAVFDELIRNVFLPEEQRNLRNSNLDLIFKSATFCVNVLQSTGLPAVVPHVDNRDDFRFAATIYLNTPEECAGGTSFYTYNGSQVGPTSIDAGKQDEYVTDSVGPWEKIFLAEMKFNRLVLYEQNILHTAYIKPGMFENDVHRLAQMFFI